MIDCLSYDMKENKITSPEEASRVLSSYKLILSVRNLMHLELKQKNDRFEFSEQIRIAKIVGYEEDGLTDFMRVYFNAAVILNRFSKSMMKKFYDDYFSLLPASLSIDLDDDFEMRGRVISMRGDSQLSMSDILRAFYYRGLQINLNPVKNIRIRAANHQSFSVRYLNCRVMLDKHFML